MMNDLDKRFDIASGFCQMIVDSGIAFFFLGYFATVYLGLDTMSVFIFSGIIAVVIYLFGSERSEA